MFSFYCIAQSKGEIKYIASTMEVVITKDKKVLARKQFGQDVIITFDKLLKSYSITYYNENFEPKQIKLIYLEDLNDGNGTIRMRLEDNSTMLVVDILDQLGELMLMHEEKEEGMTRLFVIHNAVRQ